MKRASPVLAVLARRYERTQAGRTGESARDVLINVEQLLRESGASEGEARALAEQQLREAEQAGVLKLEPLHRRDRSSIHQIRISPAQESNLFDYIGVGSPRSVREALAAQFASASCIEVPVRWKELWQQWCERFRLAALAGQSVAPFDRSPTSENTRLLALLPRLLSWEGESLVRFASCLLCSDSKTLESLAARDKEGELRDKLRGKLGRLLEDITLGEIRALDDLGILPNPRSVLLHGPLTLRMDGQTLDLAVLRGPFRLSSIDLHKAELTTTATRCLTIENETTFHELAKLRSGVLLIQTSYPTSASLQLLQRLPLNIECWHFGDTDIEGFEILHTLRQKTGRTIRPFQMNFRPTPQGPSLSLTDRKRLESLSTLMPGEKSVLQEILAAGHYGAFEQESLGRPTLVNWPFYE